MVASNDTRGRGGTLGTAPANTTSDRAGYSFNQALHTLRSAQKPGPGSPPYSRWVNRKLGRVLAALAASARLSPNTVTMLSACCTGAGLAIVATVDVRWWVGFVVAALLLLGYALDSADGQVARLYGGGSKAGEWLDHIIDAAKVSSIHAVVLISLYRFMDASSSMLLVALGYQVVYTVMFFGMILTDQLRRSVPAAAATPAAPTAAASPGRGLLQTFVVLPIDYGILALSFVLLGWPSAFKVVYSCMFVLTSVILAGTIVRWWRQMKSVDALVASRSHVES